MSRIPGLITNQPSFITHIRLCLDGFSLQPLGKITIIVIHHQHSSTEVGIFTAQLNFTNEPLPSLPVFQGPAAKSAGPATPRKNAGAAGDSVIQTG